MIRLVKEDYKSDRARWDEFLKYFTDNFKLAVSDIYQDYGTNYRVIDIEPTMDTIKQIEYNIKSKGFKEVDRFESDDKVPSPHSTDSYIVFIREDKNENHRVVIAITYNIKEQSARIDCGYEDAEDAEYFTEKFNTKTNTVKVVNESKGKKVDISVKAPELRENEKRIIITCRDAENSIENLIRAIQGTANPGHSFPVVIDPDDSGYRQEFFIDGDGSDYIGDITIEECKEEKQDND